MISGPKLSNVFVQRVRTSAARFLLVCLLLSSLSAWAGYDELDKLLGVDTAQDDTFGRSVALSGGLLLVGSDLDDDQGVLRVRRTYLTPIPARSS